MFFRLWNRICRMNTFYVRLGYVQKNRPCGSPGSSERSNRGSGSALRLSSRSRRIKTQKRTKNHSRAEAFAWASARVSGPPLRLASKRRGDPHGDENIFASPPHLLGYILTVNGTQVLQKVRRTIGVGGLLIDPMNMHIETKFPMLNRFSGTIVQCNNEIGSEVSQANSQLLLSTNRIDNAFCHLCSAESVLVSVKHVLLADLGINASRWVWMHWNLASKGIREEFPRIPNGGKKKKKNTTKKIEKIPPLKLNAGNHWDSRHRCVTTAVLTRWFWVQMLQWTMKKTNGPTTSNCKS